MNAFDWVYIGCCLLVMTFCSSNQKDKMEKMQERIDRLELKVNKLDR